jgi:hypothetical protein
MHTCCVYAIHWRYFQVGLTRYYLYNWHKSCESFSENMCVKCVLKQQIIKRVRYKCIPCLSVSLWWILLISCFNQFYNVKQNCTIHRSILKSKTKHTTLSEQFEHSIEQSSKQRKNEHLYPSNTHIHDGSPSWLCTDTSIQCGYEQ